MVVFFSGSSFSGSSFSGSSFSGSSFSGSSFSGSSFSGSSFSGSSFSGSSFSGSSFSGSSFSGSSFSGSSVLSGTYGISISSSGRADFVSNSFCRCSNSSSCSLYALSPIPSKTRSNMIRSKF
ncbi:MAG: pentapeptide repeat-containing protein [Lachnospiraceae bacterium]